MNETALFFLAQSIIVVLAIIAAHVATKVQIAKLEVHVSRLREDHKELATKMHGMSRHLAELTGNVKSCPHLTGDKT